MNRWALIRAWTPVVVVLPLLVLIWRLQGPLVAVISVATITMFLVPMIASSEPVTAAQHNRYRTLVAHAKNGTATPAQLTVLGRRLTTAAVHTGLLVTQIEVILARNQQTPAPAVHRLATKIATAVGRVGVTVRDLRWDTVTALMAHPNLSPAARAELADVVIGAALRDMRLAASLLSATEEHPRALTGSERSRLLVALASE